MLFPSQFVAFINLICDFFKNCVTEIRRGFAFVCKFKFRHQYCNGFYFKVGREYVNKFKIRQETRKANKYFDRRFPNFRKLFRIRKKRVENSLCVRVHFGRRFCELWVFCKEHIWIINGQMGVLLQIANIFVLKFNQVDGRLFIHKNFIKVKHFVGRIGQRKINCVLSRSMNLKSASLTFRTYRLSSRNHSVITFFCPFAFALRHILQFLWEGVKRDWQVKFRHRFQCFSEIRHCTFKRVHKCSSVGRRVTNVTNTKRWNEVKICFVVCRNKMNFIFNESHLSCFVNDNSFRFKILRTIFNNLQRTSDFVKCESVHDLFFFRPVFVKINDCFRLSCEQFI